MLAVISMLVLMFLGSILIFVILLQKGRGGGLAGAFGGLGGQSAFGTKAGDVFTKITIVIACLWVVVAGLSGFALQSGAAPKFQGAVPEEPTAGAADPGVKTAPGENTDTLDATGGAKPDTGAAPGSISQPATEGTPSSTESTEPSTPATTEPEGDKAASDSEKAAEQPNP